MAGNPLAVWLLALPGATTWPKPLLLFVATDTERVRVPGYLLSQFVQRHAGKTFVTAHAAEFHWSLIQEFESPEDRAATNALWGISRSYRLLDPLLLDQLVHLAESGVNTARDLCVVVRDCMGLELEDEQCIVDALLRTASAPLSDELAAPGARQAEAILGVWMVVAQRAMAQPVFDQGTCMSYGPLSVGLQVQGDIALTAMQRARLRTEVGVFPSAKRDLRKIREEHSRSLLHGRNCFVSIKGHMQFADELPAVTSHKKLQAWIEMQTAMVVDRHDLPMPNVGENKNLSTSPNEWGDEFYRSAKLYAWKKCFAAGGALQFLDRLAAGVSNVTYGVLPRIESVPPMDELEMLAGRGAIYPPPEATFVIVSFEDLELRALAAICELRFEHSESAQIYRQGGNVVEQLASVLEDTLETFTPLENSTHDAWRIVSRRLLNGLALQWGADSIRMALYYQDGIDMSATVMEQLEGAAMGAIPELRQLSDDTVERLVASLGASRSGIEDGPLRRATTKDIHRTIAGKHRSSSAAQLFNHIAHLNRREPLIPLFEGQNSAMELYSALFTAPTKLPTGRIRGAAPHFWPTAPYLDLTDDAIKAALYAVVAAGFRPATIIGFDAAFLLEPTQDSHRACDEIARFAREAASSVLGGIPVICSCRSADSW